LSDYINPKTNSMKNLTQSIMDLSLSTIPILLIQVIFLQANYAQMPGIDE